MLRPGRRLGLPECLGRYIRYFRRARQNAGHGALIINIQPFSEPSRYTAGISQIASKPNVFNGIAIPVDWLTFCIGIRRPP